MGKPSGCYLASGMGNSAHRNNPEWLGAAYPNSIVTWGVSTKAVVVFVCFMSAVCICDKIPQTEVFVLRFSLGRMCTGTPVPPQVCQQWRLLHLRVSAWIHAELRPENMHTYEGSSQQNIPCCHHFYWELPLSSFRFLRPRPQLSTDLHQQRRLLHVRVWRRICAEWGQENVLT